MQYVLSSHRIFIPYYFMNDLSGSSLKIDDLENLEKNHQDWSDI